MLDRRTVNAIKRAYTDVKNSSIAFTSKRNILREVRKSIKSVTLKDVEKYLQGLDSYTLHRRSVQKFPTRKFITQGVNSEWQTDLIVLSSKHARLNKYRYLLCSIDSFSRKLQVACVKKKTSNEMIKKFSAFIRKQGRPTSILSDAGSEFTSKEFRKFLRKRKIKYFIARNPWHAGIIERCQRTLKERIFKYMTHHKTNIFVPKLQDFVRAYNATPHSALPNNLSPSQINKSNEKLVWKFQYASTLRKAGVPSQNLKVGQLVRITRQRGTFRKGYETRFTKEKFVITHVYPSLPPTYRIKSKLKEDEVEGLFYEQELQPVS